MAGLRAASWRGNVKPHQEVGRLGPPHKCDDDLDNLRRLILDGAEGATPARARVFSARHDLALTLQSGPLPELNALGRGAAETHLSVADQPSPHQQTVDVRISQRRRI